MSSYQQQLNNQLKTLSHDFRTTLPCMLSNINNEVVNFHTFERSDTCTLIEELLRAVCLFFSENLSLCMAITDCTFVRDVRVIVKHFLSHIYEIEYISLYADECIYFLCFHHRNFSLFCDILCNQKAFHTILLKERASITGPLLYIFQTYFIHISKGAQAGLFPSSSTHWIRMKLFCSGKEKYQNCPNLKKKITILIYRFNQNKPSGV